MSAAVTSPLQVAGHADLPERTGALAATLAEGAAEGSSGGGGGGGGGGKGFSAGRSSFMSGAWVAVAGCVDDEPENLHIMRPAVASSMMTATAMKTLLPPPLGFFGISLDIGAFSDSGRELLRSQAQYSQSPPGLRVADPPLPPSLADFAVNSVNMDDCRGMLGARCRRFRANRAQIIGLARQGFDAP